MKLALFSTFVLAATAMLHKSKKSTFEHCEDISECMKRSRDVLKSCLAEEHSLALVQSVQCGYNNVDLLLTKAVERRVKEQQEFSRCRASISRRIPMESESPTCTGDLMRYHYATGTRPSRRTSLWSTFQHCYALARPILDACLPLLDCCDDERRCALLFEATNRRKRVLFSEYKLSYVNEYCF